MEEKEAQKKKVVVQSDLELTPADRGLARSPGCKCVGLRKPGDYEMFPSDGRIPLGFSDTFHPLERINFSIFALIRSAEIGFTR
jgi:hypothetical protein